MRIGLIIETLTHLILALTTNPIVAMATFFFSEHTPSFGGPPRSRSVNAVPNELRDAWAPSTWLECSAAS